MNPTVSALIANGYAPDFSAGAVLTSCPPPRNASSPVLNWRASWLAVVTAENVWPEHAADLDALVTGGACVPVRVEGKTRQYLFRTAPCAPFLASKSASAYDPASQWERRLSISAASGTAAINNMRSAPASVPLSGDWPHGSLLDIRADELPLLDESAAQAIAQAFESFVMEHAPEKPAYVPPPLEPILAANQKLEWSNQRARLTLQQNGFLVCPVAPNGSVPGGRPWERELPEHGIGLAINNSGTALIVIDVSWAVPAQNAEIYARLGHPARGAEVAAGIVERIERLANGAPIATRRTADSVTLVFRSESQAPFHHETDVIRAADGVHNSAVTIKCRTRGSAPVVIGDDGWATDLFKTQYSALASLAEYQWHSTLADIDSWLQAGAELDKPQTVEEPPPVTRRGRKGAAVASIG